MVREKRKFSFRLKILPEQKNNKKLITTYTSCKMADPDEVPVEP
jgi:hypothetical protein